MDGVTIMRFGLVGYGAWCRHHARVIRATPGCELCAVCASTNDSRVRAHAETGSRTVGDFRKLVTADDLDVVSIVVPNSLHEAVAIAALESGKHVLLEKPMATSVEACDRIIRAASRSGRLLLVGHEMRFSPLYTRMHEFLDRGEIGNPRYLLIDLWRQPYRPGSGQWRKDPARVGNWTLEEPVHFFDLAGWFMETSGLPAKVYALGAAASGVQPLRSEMADHFTALVTYADGA